MSIAVSAVRPMIASAALALSAGSLIAAEAASSDAPAARRGVMAHAQAPGQAVPSFRIDMGMVPSTLYATGEQVEWASEQIWTPVCGSDMSQITAADLEDIAMVHQAEMEAGDVIIVDSPRPRGGGGINIVYTLAGSVPAAAVPAFADAEAFYESIFGDPITVRVSVSFQNLGGGVLGSTGPQFTVPNYSTTRTGMINGMDGDDAIQAFLPTGTTVPVRYNGSSSTVTNEGFVFFTRAAYASTIGSQPIDSASMTYNSAFNWDYDPSNGVPGTAQSFVDVVIHETGHALGFTSRIDFQEGNLDVLDLARFQRTDGSGDYNPDTNAEFQTTPRTVDFNNPNDNQNFDIISTEVRFSDGNPWQASHWREQGTNLGIMDPAQANGETYIGRNYFTQADYDAFDFIGFDYPPCATPNVTTNPNAQTLCEGDTLILSADAGESVTYQWKRDGTDLTNGGGVSGATSSVLMISSVTVGDEGTYACEMTATDDGCAVNSSGAFIEIGQNPQITTQPPANVTVDEGDNAVFAIGSFPTEYTFQWRKDGAPLADGGDISGSQSIVLVVANAEASDEGTYDCVVTDDDPPNCEVVSTGSVLTVNEVSSCPADIDMDGDADADDIAAFVDLFVGAGLADIDMDGDEDADDIAAFVNAFVAGC